MDKRVKITLIVSALLFILIVVLGLMNAFSPEPDAVKVKNTRITQDNTEQTAGPKVKAKVEMRNNSYYFPKERKIETVKKKQVKLLDPNDTQARYGIEDDETHNADSLGGMALDENDSILHQDEYSLQKEDDIPE
ncbi:MAG: hypothetical protein HY810_02105 [Candidatus Omnitrophica bacterium]|nr:hypothetical protein [Candidatus Omnitrophota bacterium]